MVYLEFQQSCPGYTVDYIIYSNYSELRFWRRPRRIIVGFKGQWDLV